MLVVIKDGGYRCGERSSFDRIRPRQTRLCTVSGILREVKNTLSGYSIIRN